MEAVAVLSEQFFELSGIVVFQTLGKFIDIKHAGEKRCARTRMEKSGSSLFRSNNTNPTPKSMQRDSNLLWSSSVSVEGIAIYVFVEKRR